MSFHKCLCALMLGLLFSLCSTWPYAAPHQPESVAFWYADQPPLAELAQFDWVVLESAHVSSGDVAFLREQGSQAFAYLSIGEFDGDADALERAGLAKAASNVRNRSWNSQVMDLSASAWRHHLLQRVSALRAQGYAGVFLDTLDSFQLLPEAQREAQRQALASLLDEIGRQEPGFKLFFNRGFEVLPELSGRAAAVAIESIHAGWDAGAKRFRKVPEDDRAWLKARTDSLRAQGVPLVAIDYLPAHQRGEARKLAQQLSAEGYIPFVTVPDLNYLGISTIEVQPRRIAVLYDPDEDDLSQNPAQIHLGGLLEYLGYRVDYLAADEALPRRPASGLYAGVVTWMTNGTPRASRAFEDWLGARLDEHVPIAILGGLPVEGESLLRRLGLRQLPPFKGTPSRVERDEALLGQFEAPFKLRLRALPQLAVGPDGPQSALTLTDSQGQGYTPVAIGDWGGIALAPYVLESNQDTRRWVLDPFLFLEKALQLPPLPRPDATTENGRRIATVHIDGDGFVSRAEVRGTPYAGQLVFDEFIKPIPLLTSVSVIEGEIGPKGMYPYLSNELEPIARRIFADPKVEVATHTFSHPFFWQTRYASLDKGYGDKLSIPGYDRIDFQREIVGSRDYINQRLTTPDKPVKMLFWSGDALPDAATIKLAYESGLPNVNGGNTALTKAYPSLTGLYPLIRPTEGGIQYYAPVINENFYTNLWHGPYYGFRDVLDTFELTDSPRRLRGLHLYYHFYSGTKQASIKVLHDIYAAIEAQQPISLWMSDYLKHLHGLHEASLARRFDGRWQVRAMDGLRTLRLDPALGWPDLARSTGVAGVRELPQGRYLHLAGPTAMLALRADRDPAPALEEANLPLLEWDYLGPHSVRFSFAGEVPLRFSVRSAGTCKVTSAGTAYIGRQGKGLWHFDLPMKRVTGAQLDCN